MVVNRRVSYNADERLDSDLLKSHHHHHLRAKQNKQVRCILRITQDMLPVFHVKGRLNFWKISVQVLKVLYIKATHEHDT
jgi:hypothetical protein